MLDTPAEAAFDDIAALAARITNSAMALVSLVDVDRQWFKARIGLDMAETPRAVSFCAHAILEPATPLVVPDARADSRFADNPLVLGAPGIRFYTGVPLVNPAGHALGTLCVLDRAPRTPDADQVANLRSLARTVVTTLELRRVARQARAEAVTDGLTGLANRPTLLSGLAGAIARQRRDHRPLSLLVLDLDGFKQVPPAQADALLQDVAALIQNAVRQEDIVARMGLDRFAAVLVGGDGREAALVAERVRAAIATGATDTGATATGAIGITASVGAVAFRAAPRNAAHALQMAEQMMARARTAGGNRVLHCAFPGEILPLPLRPRPASGATG